nr:MAG TPA: hypothetical protein [Caudoviricetes sp.]
MWLQLIFSVILYYYKCRTISSKAFASHCTSTGSLSSGLLYSIFTLSIVSTPF